MANIALNTLQDIRPGQNFDNIKRYKENFEYPKVFDEVSKIIGMPLLLQQLRFELKPSTAETKIYDLLCQWPVPVYLTTNYDDEIQNRLTALRESYITYSNDEDHLNLLVPEFNGAIYKLHGDLRSEKGLILTDTHYKEIMSSSDWEFWRTKMTSVFQMNRIVIVGYSLTDSHIQHILRLAKKGAGVTLPICWIAPDVTIEESKKYLEEYRIRVISYDNRDGQHQNLLRLLESISDFIPKRISITIRQSLDKLLQSNLPPTSAAPGFFVYNKLFAQDDFEDKRIKIIIAAISSILPRAKERNLSTLKDFLALTGWPENNKLSSQLEKTIISELVNQNLCTFEDKCLLITEKAIENSHLQLSAFQHTRDRFLNSVILRIKQKFPPLIEDAERIANDIDASLVTFFKEGGVTLASMLFSKNNDSTTLPLSISKFIQEASQKYNDILLRQAFFSISVEIFIRSTSADHDYLGSIAQGFFAFHMLGAFGEVAKERFLNAVNTVWLVDSSLQIYCLALASTSNTIFRESFIHLKSMGIRLFSTNSLFEETIEHLWFANKIVRENGANSYYVIAAARGDSPYRKSNVFLEGFIRWQSIGKIKDWDSYLFELFQTPNFLQNSYITDEEKIIIKKTLANFGIEVQEIIDWPGFVPEDTQIINDTKEKIIKKILDSQHLIKNNSNSEVLSNPYDKASPEAEALLLVSKERSGEYYILSEIGQKTPCWFISDTSMLNSIASGLRITWPTISFLNFANTLFPQQKDGSSERSFETLLFDLSRSGLNLLDDNLVDSVFSGIIDETTISLNEQRGIYEKTLSEKYGEDPELVLNKLSSIYRPMALIQLVKEMAENAKESESLVKDQLQKSILREKQVETELRKVEKYRNRALRKENRTKMKKNKKKK
jgi:hypothetical protein